MSIIDYIQNICLLLLAIDVILLDRKIRRK